jgi:hypothetical protein
MSAEEIASIFNVKTVREMVELTFCVHSYLCAN